VDGLDGFGWRPTRTIILQIIKSPAIEAHNVTHTPTHTTTITLLRSSLANATIIHRGTITDRQENAMKNHSSKEIASPKRCFPVLRFCSGLLFSMSAKWRNGDLWR
jgi:hypothetical protein